MVAMRVCPFCGEPPGAGVFCEACGRNLAEVDQLPTRAEWEASQRALTVGVDEFLSAMRAAGNPGTIRVPSGPSKAFRRAPTIDGWIVVAVDRDEDDLSNGRYAPGLFLSVDGSWHRLDNEVRGWGQRDFPQFQHTVAPEPVAAPGGDEVGEALAAVLRKQRVERSA
jgi:hypothetical protein